MVSIGLYMGVYMLDTPGISTDRKAELTWRSWIPNLIDMVIDDLKS